MEPGEGVPGQGAPWKPARVGLCSAHLGFARAELDCAGLGGSGLESGKWELLPARGLCPAQASSLLCDFEIDEMPLALLQTHLCGERLWFHVYEWNLEETAKPPQAWCDPYSHDHLQLCTLRVGIWWPEASTARCL